MFSFKKRLLFLFMSACVPVWLFDKCVCKFACGGSKKAVPLEQELQVVITVTNMGTQFHWNSKQCLPWELSLQLLVCLDAVELQDFAYIGQVLYPWLHFPLFLLDIAVGVVPSVCSVNLGLELCDFFFFYSLVGTAILVLQMESEVHVFKWV